MNRPDVSERQQLYSRLEDASFIRLKGRQTQQQQQTCSESVDLDRDGSFWLWRFQSFGWRHEGRGDHELAVGREFRVQFVHVGVLWNRHHPTDLPHCVTVSIFGLLLAASLELDIATGHVDFHILRTEEITASRRQVTFELVLLTIRVEGRRQRGNFILRREHRIEQSRPTLGVQYHLIGVRHIEERVAEQVVLETRDLPVKPADDRSWALVERRPLHEPVVAGREAVESHLHTHTHTRPNSLSEISQSTGDSLTKSQIVAIQRTLFRDNNRCRSSTHWTCGVL